MENKFKKCMECGLDVVNESFLENGLCVACREKMACKKCGLRMAKFYLNKDGLCNKCQKNKQAVIDDEPLTEDLSKCSKCGLGFKHYYLHSNGMCDKCFSDKPRCARCGIAVPKDYLDSNNLCINCRGKVGDFKNNNSNKINKDSIQSLRTDMILSKETRRRKIENNHKKTLFGIGVFLILGGVVVNNATGQGAWMSQVGIIFLFGSVAIFAAERHSWKIVEMISLSLMFFWLGLGFLSGLWSAHPFGFVVALAECIWVAWVFYCGVKINTSHELNSNIKKYEEVQQKNGAVNNADTPQSKASTLPEISNGESQLSQNPSPQQPQEVSLYQRFGWLGVPISYLLLLHWNENFAQAFWVSFIVLIIVKKDKILELVAGEFMAGGMLDAKEHPWLAKLSKKEQGKEVIKTIIAVLVMGLCCVVGLLFAYAFLVPVTCSVQELVNSKFLSKKVCNVGYSAFYETLRGNSLYRGY